MTTTQSNSIDWDLETEEEFGFLFTTWDVREAKRRIAAAPREIEQVKVSDLAPFLSSTAKREDGGFRIQAGIIVTRERVASDPTIDLTVPLIGAVTRGGSALPIDGWHRVAKAEIQGVEELPIVFLTADESAEVEI